MPWRPHKPCAAAGCPELTHDRFCDEHRKENERTRHRANTAARGVYNSRRWALLRQRVRAEEPLCRSCLDAGRVAATEEIDHIIPLKDRIDLAFVRSNLAGRCRPCHREKSARERRGQADQELCP